MGKTCRIVTTSVADHHLNVLWGEIGRFLSLAETPIIDGKPVHLRYHPVKSPDGALIVNHHEIRRHNEMDSKNPLSYLKGQVSAKGEGLAGHHSETSLFVADEASGLDDLCYEMAQGWMKRALIFGNPNPCQNFFRKMVDGGNIEDVA